MNIDFGNTEHISSNKGTTSGEVAQQHYIPALTRRPTKSGSEGSIKSWQSMVNSHPRSPEGTQEDKQAIEPGMKYKWVGNNTAQGGYWKKWWPSTTAHYEAEGRKPIDNAPLSYRHQRISNSSAPNTSSTLNFDRNCREPPSTTQLPLNGRSNTWMNQPLVETPFWEKKDEDQPSQASSSTTGSNHQSDQQQAPFSRLHKSGPSFTAAHLRSHQPLLVDIVEQPQHQQFPRTSQVPPYFGSTSHSIIIPTSPMKQATTTQSKQHNTWETDENDDILWNSINKSITSVYGTDTTSSNDNNKSSCTDNTSKSSTYMDWISNEHNQLQAASPPSTDSDHLHSAETPSSPVPAQQVQYPSFDRWKFPANRTQYPPASKYQRPHGVATTESPTQPIHSHNPVVINVRLELENGRKVIVSIRKMDDPHHLAHSFCHAQNITKTSILQGVADLFFQQKSWAMQRYTR
ncbi:hypothetical protein [Absidia glauca]|uniref:Uncharacterized protein n=1 Tax=Absidia glauca TaxID=4829 RepID=A0A163J4U2_ABSGL|nr:hypothetical protein [Absidia glauca]